MKYIVLILSTILFLFMGNFGMGIIIIPIEYLVTIIHELGHASACWLTGGHVNLVEISPTGGGFTQTSGGMESLVIMSGYLGSVIFANIFIFFGFTSYKISRIISILLGGFFIFSAIILFNSLGSTIIQLIYGSFFLLVGWKLYKISNYVLIALGSMSLIDVLQNFNVHPQSDLQMYSQIMGGNPNIWMYFWLILAIMISGVNLFLIYKKGGLKNEKSISLD